MEKEQNLLPSGNDLNTNNKDSSRNKHQRYWKAARVISLFGIIEAVSLVLWSKSEDLNPNAAYLAHWAGNCGLLSGGAYLAHKLVGERRKLWIIGIIWAVWIILCIVLFITKAHDLNLSNNSKSFFVSTNLSSTEKIEIADLVGQINKIANSRSAADDTYPGFSWNLGLILDQPTPRRNNFIADLGERPDQNRISIFVDADKNLCFRVIGDNGNPTTLQVHQFYNTFLFDNKIWLTCDYGMTTNFCLMRMYINGKLVAENLHANTMKSATQWMSFQNPTIPRTLQGSAMIMDDIIFGQDINFENAGSFTLASVMLFKSTLPQNKLEAIGEAFAWIDGLHNP